MFRILLCSVLLCACAKENPNRGSEPAPVTVDPLANKSAAEVLKIKYDKAVLNCKLWVQYGSELVTNVPASSQFSVDLLSENKPQKSFELRGSAMASEVEAKITIEDIKIENFNLTDVDGTQYTFEFSPVVYFQHSYKTRLQPAMYVSGHHSGVFHEKIKTAVLDASSPVAGLHYFEYLGCILDTEIKGPYRNQFRKKAP